MVSWTDKEREAWEPRPAMTVVEWSRENLYLSRRSGAALPGLYRPDITPYVIEPLNEWSNPRTEKIVLCWATQTGKTTVMFAWLGYAIDYDPGSILWVMTSDEICDYTSRNRIQPLIEDCPSLLRKFPPRYTWALREMPFDGGVLRAAGANSPGKLSSQPARYLLEDEIAKYPANVGKEAGAQDLAEERTKAQPMPKIGACSTPVQEGDNILTDLEDSDYRQYWVPCPHCGEYQLLIWEMVCWPHEEDGGSVKPAAARANTWLECGQCQGEIRERHKRWMLENGRWVPREQRIEPVADDAAAGVEDWEITLEDGRRRRYQKLGELTPNAMVGFHLNGLYSPLVSWGKLVEQWLKSQGSPSKLQNFINSVLAKPWKQQAAEAQLSELTKLIDLQTPEGVVPEGFEFVIAAADYHGPRYGVRWSVWAFAADYQSAMIEYGETATLGDFGEGVADKLYPNRAGDLQAVDVTVVDSGYETVAVYDFCRSRLRCLPVKGQTGQKIKPVSPRQLDKYPDGKAIRGGLTLLLLSSDAWKDEMYFQLTGATGKTRLHAGTGKDFLESLSSEKRIVKVDTLNRQSTEWAVKHKSKTHYWDTSCYARAAARWFIPQLVEVRRKRKSRPPEVKAGRKIRTRY